MDFQTQLNAANDELSREHGKHLERALEMLVAAGWTIDRLKLVNPAPSTVPVNVASLVIVRGADGYSGVEVARVWVECPDPGSEPVAFQVKSRVSQCDAPPALR